MRIQIINGPNLNLLGKREPGIYGSEDFESYLEKMKQEFTGHELFYFQSNVEGELINKLHECNEGVDGVILNAGGYTHTSVAIGDAVAAINTPVIEVHISNVFAREEYRHQSMLSKHCSGIITGFGLNVYRLAVIAFAK
ncbi:MAG: type II 3-dehydroquinate dehydratase [Bacteroidota bacterium]